MLRHFDVYMYHSYRGVRLEGEGGIGDRDRWLVIGITPIRGGSGSGAIRLELGLG